MFARMYNYLSDDGKWTEENGCDKFIIEFSRTHRPFYGTNCNIRPLRFAFDLELCSGFPAIDYL